LKFVVKTGSPRGSHHQVTLNSSATTQIANMLAHLAPLGLRTSRPFPILLQSGFPHPTHHKINPLSIATCCVPFSNVKPNFDKRIGEARQGRASAERRCIPPSDNNGFGFHQLPLRGPALSPGIDISHLCFQRKQGFLMVASSRVGIAAEHDSLSRTWVFLANVLKESQSSLPRPKPTRGNSTAHLNSLLESTAVYIAVDERPLSGFDILCSVLLRYPVLDKVAFRRSRYRVACEKYNHLQDFFCGFGKSTAIIVPILRLGCIGAAAISQLGRQARM
jgi:hypothetical protein